MRVTSIILGAGATAVAIGGIYLLLSLKHGDAAPTPEQALAAAQGASGSARADGERGDRNGSARARPGMPQRRDTHATFDADAATRTVLPAPQTDYRKGGNPAPIDMPAKFRADLVNPQEYDAPSPEQTEALLEANKLYDRGDFDNARSLAKKMLGTMPGNVRMLRVVVSSACIMGDGDDAQRYAAELPPGDHAAMVARCAKYEISLDPQKRIVNDKQ